MRTNYNENVYTILSDTLEIKFKVQLRDSGIVLKKFYSIKNLEDNEEGYMLFVNETGIMFQNKNELIVKFCRLLEENIKDLYDQSKKIQWHASNDLVVDDNFIYNEEERIGHQISKQQRLIDRLIKLAD